jgi:hypothetical protein
MFVAGLAINVAQVGGWESHLMAICVILRDGKGHFYMEPVRPPGLLPTPVTVGRMEFMTP